MTIRSMLVVVLAIASSPSAVLAFTFGSRCMSWTKAASLPHQTRAASVPAGGRPRRPGTRTKSDDGASRDRFVVYRWASQVAAASASASVVDSSGAEEEEGNPTGRQNTAPATERPAPPQRSAAARRAKAPRFVQAAHQQRQQQQLQQDQQLSSSQQPKSLLRRGGREAGVDEAAPIAPRREGGTPSLKQQQQKQPPTPQTPPSHGRRSTAPPALDKDRMWKRSKTIEELESTLTARWGTDARQWTDYDDADDDDDDENGNLIGSGNQGGSGGESASSSSSSSSARPAVRARPVLDPWGFETKPPTKTKGRETTTSFKVSDLIRDKPVGGFGVRQPSTADPTKAAAAAAATNPGPGFFFRPPPQSTVEERAGDTRATTSESSSTKRSVTSEPSAATSGARSGLQKAGRDDNDDDDKRPSRSSPPPPSRPLLDERDGVTPIFLTIEQAVRNYEEARMALPQSTERELAERENADEQHRAELSEAAPSAAQPSWTDLGVTSHTLLKNLERMGCTQPLPVQSQMLEYLLSPTDDGAPASELRMDVICGTMTGSGKTLSFLVPLAQRLIDHVEGSPEGNSSPPPQVMVVAPGRELASQIVSVARDLLQDTDLGVQLAIGGTTFARNLEAIRKRKPHIIVGTPGRLAELVAGRPGEGKGRLAKIFKPGTLVLDEFDALLEYKTHREKSLALLQVLRRDPSMQTIVCSATASDMMRGADGGESMGAGTQSQRALIDDYLRPGYRVAMAQSSDVLTASGTGGSLIGTRVSRTVIHGVVHVPHRRFALETLRRILHTDPFPQQVLVFVKDSHAVKIVVERLERDGIIAAPLSGDDDKMDRADVSRALREGYVGLVVATELAARGLDAPLLTHVINLDLPTDASHYAHRAGRCGRGNRPGVVINVTTMPQERSVPRRLADKLGVDMYTVEVRNGKLNVVDPSSQTLDSR